MIGHDRIDLRIQHRYFFVDLCSVPHFFAVHDVALDERTWPRAVRRSMAPSVFCPVSLVEGSVLLDSFRSTLCVWGVEILLSSPFDPGARTELSSLGAWLSSIGWRYSNVGTPSMSYK